MADTALDALSQEDNKQATAIFELLPGMVLDLQISHPVPVRLKLSLVGYETGKYIILKYPASSFNFNDVLVEGNMVIVRYLLEGDQGCCFAFRTTIRSISKSPEKFIFLTYPKHIENRQLREHQRITTHLPASISIKANLQRSNELQGIITDLSMKGCGFTFKAKNEIVNVKQKEVFVCVNHNTLGEIRIPANVQNSRNDKGRVNVGIRFNENDKQVATLLEHLFVDTSL